MSEPKPILVVDDQPLIRMTIAEVLAEAGYATLQAKDGPAAIEQIDRGVQLCALVTDIRLGRGESGWEVAQYARDKFPALAVVYITADSAGDWSVNGVPLGVFLQKPFASAQLLITISDLLRPQGQCSGVGLN